MRSKYPVMMMLACGLLSIALPGCTQPDNDGTASENSDTAYIPLSDFTPLPDLGLCADIVYPQVTDFAVYQTPAAAEPDPRVPFYDPVFGTCVVRVTDRKLDISENDDSGGLKNEYSRVQSFNADGSLLVARGTEGTWYLYDVASLQPRSQLPVEDEPRWDASIADYLYYIDETRLMRFNVQTGVQTMIHNFAEDFPQQRINAAWTRYEGSPSFDGRYWGLMIEDKDWLPIAFLIYDLQTDQIIATRMLSDRLDVDSVTISPLGTYFLAFYDNYCEHGIPGNDTHPCGLMVYDHNLENGRSLLRIVGHADTAVDADGREVLIYQDIDTDDIALLDLASGAVIPLFPIDFTHSPIGLHFSGRASALPGWALVSTYSGGYPEDRTWMDDAVFAVELKADGRVVRLAHTYSLVDERQEHDYWAEPQASVNPDFTRVVFTSNRGRSGTDAVDMYMLALPPDWTTELP